MQTFTITKPAVRSSDGIVVAQNRRAANAGASVLRDGGNAIDAAVATMLVLSVVEPWMSGLGGGGFLVRADGKTGTVATLDFNVRSPRKLDPADYPLADGTAGGWFGWPEVVGRRNMVGYTSIAVPGAVAGMGEALRAYGSQPWAKVIQPAIDEARRGLEVDWYASLLLGVDAPGLAQFPSSAATYLHEGRAPYTGETSEPLFLPLPKQLALLERLGVSGPEDFYHGEIARSLIEDLQTGGSRIAHEDLASYSPRWADSLVSEYRGVSVHAVPGLCGGPPFLDALNQVRAGGLHAGSDRAQSAILIGEAVREAYAHRLATAGHGATTEAGCTSHVCVVDRDGTMVSVTNTLLSRFGSKVVLPRTGLLMNNGMMWFDPVLGRPNSIAPGVRPLANMCPIVLTQNGFPVGALGAAGGRTIFPAVLQILSALLDRQLSIEDAFMALRIEPSAQTILVNEREDPEVAQALERRFPTAVVQDTVYPTRFATPSAIIREAGVGFVGMAHHMSPWAAAVAS